MKTEEPTNTAPASGVPAPAVQSGPDPIQFREYKILLKAELFKQPESFPEFWKIVRRTAKSLGIETIKHDKGNRVREVVFFDTPDFTLYNHHFIVRARRFYHDGFLEAEQRLALKFRHPERSAAEAVNVHPAIEAVSRIRFKEELLPEKDKLGGMRTIFSHACVLPCSSEVLNQRLADIATVFPGVAAVGIAPKTQLEVVNNTFITEVFSEIGQIHFTDKTIAEATVAIWRNRATETPLVGEFAYQIEFDRLENLHKKPKELSEALYRTLQLEARDWIQLGSTKTALVYKSGNVPVKNDE